MVKDDWLKICGHKRSKFRLSKRERGGKQTKTPDLNPALCYPHIGTQSKEKDLRFLPWKICTSYKYTSESNKFYAVKKMFEKFGLNLMLEK